jgi:hypothetical protein
MHVLIVAEAREDSLSFARRAFVKRLESQGYRCTAQHYVYYGTYILFT